ARVAGEVELRAVLGLDDDPAGLAEVVAVVARARVEGVHERELDARGLDGAALVRSGHVSDGRALAAEPALQLDLGDDLGREALRELDGLADVVAVAVGDRDDVDPLGLLLALGALGVGEERVDVDALAARGVEAKRGVAEPRELDVWHAPEVISQERPTASRKWRPDGSSGARRSSRPRRRARGCLR